MDDDSDDDNNSDVDSEEWDLEEGMLPAGSRDPEDCCTPETNMEPDKGLFIHFQVPCEFSGV